MLASSMISYISANKKFVRIFFVGILITNLCGFAEDVRYLCTILYLYFLLG